MNITVVNLSNPPLFFSRDLPAGFAGALLPGGEVYYAQGPFGCYCIQEYVAPEFVIRYSILRTKQSLRLVLKSRHSGLHSLMMLKSDLVPFIYPAGSLWLKEGNFTVYQGSEPEMRIHFLQNTTFIAFEAMLSNDLAAESLIEWPEIRKRLLQSAPRLPDVWINPPARTSDGATKLIEECFSFVDHPDEQAWFLREQVRELVPQLLANFPDEAEHNAVLRPEEIAKVVRVQDLILADLTIKESGYILAKKVGLSATVLKRIFKQYEGASIHQFRVQKRLDATLDMLHAGKFLEEVAADTGWSVSTLIKAYKKRFGRTPSTDNPNKNK